MVSKVHLSNTKLLYFSHLHYTNWGGTWPQLYFLSLVILTDKKNWCGASASNRLCVLVHVFIFKWIIAFKVIQIDHETGVEWCSCVKILNRYTFESQTGRTWPLLTCLVFLDCLYCFSTIMYKSLSASIVEEPVCHVVYDWPYQMRTVWKLF